MNQEIKQKWLDALRSNEYPQSRGELKNENGYCCLGVLCDVYRKEVGTSEWQPFMEGAHTYSFQGRTDYLPQAVQEWIDIDPAVQHHLADMNDSGLDFTAIAGRIEADY